MKRMPMFDKARYRDADGKKRDWYCGDVLSGHLEVAVVFEGDRVLAFHHPDPGAPIHVVVIPKAHIASQAGFFVRANAAAPGVSPHMHWHVMGPGVDPPKVEVQP
jgi:diadenosine tetraphosphate (Ap4A) HIT family hydrolase